MNHCIIVTQAISLIPLLDVHHTQTHVYTDVIQIERASYDSIAAWLLALISRTWGLPRRLDLGRSDKRNSKNAPPPLRSVPKACAQVRRTCFIARSTATGRYELTCDVSSLKMGPYRADRIVLCVDLVVYPSPVRWRDRAARTEGRASGP